MELTTTQAWFYGLLVACPHGQPLSDCPLEKYRKGSWKDKLHTLEQMSEQTMNDFIEHHNQCLLKRV